MWWYAFSNEEHSEVMREVVAVVCEKVVGLGIISETRNGCKFKVMALLLYMFP